MKYYFVVFVCAFVILISACNRSQYYGQPGAHGNPGNIMVVMENNTWNSEPGDSIRAVFHQYCPALPKEEHLFTLHQVPRERFIDHNRYHRNIIFCEISSERQEAKTTVTRDRYAKRQLFVNISAPSPASFSTEVSKQKDRLVKLFLDEDRDRYLYHIRNHKNQTVVNMLRNKHEISLSVPTNYTVDVNKDNFVWIAFETVKYSMGIFVYHWTLSDSSSFTREYLIGKRNEILKENVPGEIPGNYMTTEQKYYPPYLYLINHNNLQTAYIQGLWRMHGDFMGGPFVSYTKIDNARNRMVTVEGFVYNPNEELRDMIRRLDAILYTFDLIK